MFAHTAMITRATGCGKTYYVMKLLTEGVYRDYFDVVLIICPTFFYIMIHIRNIENYLV